MKKSKIRIIYVRGKAFAYMNVGKLVRWYNKIY